MPAPVRVRHLTRSAAIAGIVLVATVVPLLSMTAVAHGDEIGDLQQRAAKISAQMDDLQSQIIADANALEAARYKASQIDAQISRAKCQLASAKRAEAADRKQLANFALKAYISGGSDGSGLSAVLNTRLNELGQRQGYVSAAVGDRQQLVDNLQASQRVTSDRAASLSSARKAATEIGAQAKARQQDAQQAADRLARIKSQLDGRLATLVAERQAAAQKAAEQRAEAQAQAAAARSKAAAATTSAAAQIPPVTQQAPPPAATQASQTPASTAPSRGTAPSSGSGGFSPPPNASAAAVAIAAAQSQLGVRYVMGGATPGVAFDCSGLTMWAYAQAGVRLTHYTYTQETEGRVVPLSQIQPGDLVFYYGGEHVALYVGGGSVIHAPHTGDVVRYASLYMSTPTLVVRPTG